jgi:tetratricopeptide (TPR) repeat protein
MTVQLPFLLLAFLAAAGPQGPPSEEIVVKSREAQEAFSGGRFQEAAERYGELARVLPDIPGLKMNHGMALYLAGRPQSAVSPLREAVNADPDLTPGWFFLGASLLDTGRADEAVEPLETFLRKNPSEADAIELLAEAYRRSGRFDRAVERFRTLLELDARNPRAWFGLGRAYEALAERAFDLLEETAFESAYWFALIAESRVVQQQYSSAFFFYRKALELKPDLRGIHVAISRIYRQTGNPEWADREEQKEIELGLPDCERERFVCRYLEGRFEDLLAEASKDDEPESLYWRIQAANGLVLQAFSRLTELPPSVEVHGLKAEIHRNQGRHWESVREWRAALELDPGNPELRRELALSLYLNRDYDGSRKIVDELLERSPDSPMLNFLAGDCLLNQQRVEDAVPFLEKAANLDPDYLGARSALGRAYVHVGDSDKAIPHLRAALPTDDDGSLHFQLARAYQRAGERDLAQEMMRRYQEIDRRVREEESRVEEEVRITPP